MTPVKFKFLTPLGNPIANQEFHVSLNKAAIHSLDNGFVHPEVITTITDAQGEATLELFPADQPYYVTMDVNADINGEQCCTGIRFRIAVPDLDTLVWADKLVVRDPIFSKPWDAEAIEIIMAAKAAAAASAAAAKESELIVVEKAAEVASNTQIVVDNTALAVDAAARAATSETNAKNSETAAGLSQTAAHNSELAAGNSATTAAQKAGEAAASVLQAQEYASQSQASAVASDLFRVGAVTAADNSAASATASADSAITSTTNANKTAADVVTVTGLRDETTTLRDEAEVARDEAVAAAGAATGAFVDGGLIDLSGGAYPAKPLVSTIWRVTVGGTVTSTPEGTITYRAGDNLVYTKTNDVFYKTDNSQAVVSVNGRQGLVVLDKTDVGLNKVDNTTDMEKPVSTLQQAQFDIRVPTTSPSDTTVGHLVKVGDYGYNGGTPISKASTVSANDLTVEGRYIFPSGGLDLPTTDPYYVQHLTHPTTGFAKQFAWGTASASVLQRTQASGVWGNWGPVVDIVDGLTSSDPAKALSARQGKILFEMLQANNATIQRYTFNLSAGQSVITGNSLEGTPLSYVPGVPFMVEKDGFPIWFSNDYTASNGSSITLAKPATQVSEIAITVFGAFSVANHFTKAESDARYYTQTQVNTLLDTSVSRGYIEGLQLIWVSGTNIQILPGSAYVPSLGKRIAYAGGNITPITVPVINTFIHLYLNAAGTIVQSLTAPVKYFNTAWSMTGDNTNRYIGSILISTNAAGAYKFRQDLSSNKLWYIHANPTAVPFRAISAQTTPTTVSLSTVIPPTGVAVLGVFQNAGALGNIVYFTPADAGTPVSDTGWMIYLIGGAVQNAECPLSNAGAISVGGSGSAWSANLYCNGYQFER